MDFLCVLLRWEFRVRTPEVIAVCVSFCEVFRNFIYFCGSEIDTFRLDVVVSCFVVECLNEEEWNMDLWLVCFFRE